MFHITNDTLRHVIISMWHNGFKWNAKRNCRRSYACTGVPGISRVSTTCVFATPRLFVFDIAFLFVRSPSCTYIELLLGSSRIFIYNLSLTYLELINFIINVAPHHIECSCMRYLYEITAKISRQQLVNFFIFLGILLGILYRCASEL